MRVRLIRADHELEAMSASEPEEDEDDRERPVIETQVAFKGDFDEDTSEDEDNE